jgi:hypothetical protein
LIDPRKLWRICIVGFACLYLPDARAQDTELWLFQHFALERTEQREVFLTLHGRAAESDIPSLYQIQPRLAVPVAPWTWLGFNYSFFGIRQQGDALLNEDLFSNQHRLEGEIQLRTGVSRGVRYVARNRYEYLLDSDLAKVSERMRHRSQFLITSPFDERWTVVSQIELFYDPGLGRLNQTRSAPVGARVTRGEWSVQAQPLIVNLYVPESGWQSTLVANIELTYEF